MLRDFARFGSAVLERVGGPKIGGGLPVGAEAPPFDPSDIEAWLNTSNGEPVTLEALRGHDVFVEFWSIQCPACVATIGAVRKVHAGYEPAGLRTVTVHVDLHDPAAETSAVEKFLRDHALSYPVGLDRSGAVWNRFAFTHLPHGLLVGADGKVRWSGSLFSHDLEKVLRRFLGPATPSAELATSLRGADFPGQESPACDGDVCRIPPRAAKH